MGFHGTRATSVNAILEQGLRPSTGGGHWLVSNAIYLFDEPSIALGFARSLFQDDVAVLEVLYTADRQLDLTRYDVAQAISKFGQAIVDQADPAKIAGMKQTSGIRELDDFVLSEAVKVTNYRSVRAICAANGRPMSSRIFPPDRPLWSHAEKSSWLNIHNHVQIAITDVTAILRVQRYDHSGLVID